MGSSMVLVDYLIIIILLFKFISGIINGIVDYLIPMPSL